MTRDICNTEAKLTQTEGTRPYQISSSRRSTIGRFTIVQDTIEINGKEYPYSYEDSGDSACILPILRDKVVLIREYRHALNDWFWEIPAGGLSGETPEAAAIRELMEETGCKAKRLTFLGKYPDSLGRSSAYAHIFLAECAQRGAQHLEKTEFVQVHEVSFERFEEMIWTRELLQLHAIVAWEFYKRGLQDRK